MFAPLDPSSEPLGQRNGPPQRCGRKQVCPKIGDSIYIYIYIYIYITTGWVILSVCVGGWQPRIQAGVGYMVAAPGGMCGWPYMVYIYIVTCAHVMHVDVRGHSFPERLTLILPGSRKVAAWPRGLSGQGRPNMYRRYTCNPPIYMSM